MLLQVDTLWCEEENTEMTHKLSEGKLLLS